MTQRYEARKVFRWGGRMVTPGENIERLPGRNMIGMVQRGAVVPIGQDVSDPGTVTNPIEVNIEGSQREPQVAKKPRGRPTKHPVAGS